MSKKLDLVTLSALAKVANQHHSKVCQAAQTATESVQLCGKALNEAKELVPFGGWLDWLAKNCPDITPRTAQNWMKSAKCEIDSYLSKPKNLVQLFEGAGLIHEKDITPKPTVTQADEEKSVADRYCSQLGIGPGAVLQPAEVVPAPAPVEPVSHVEQSPAQPPSPPDTKLQDPTPGAPMGTGVSGGEISNHPLGPLVKLVMDEITRLGEGYAVSNLLVLSPIFQYGRCRGVEGM